MKLRFVPKPGAMPRFPKRGAGDYPYVGRRYNAEKRDHETTGGPAVVVQGGEDAKRLVELCKRDGDLLPFDKETAEYCGVSFVELECEKDGWVPKAKHRGSKKSDVVELTCVEDS